MSRPPIVISSQAGGYMLLDASGQQRWGLDTAQARLREALAGDPLAATPLRDLATQLGLDHTDDLDAVIHRVAQAIAAGGLLPFFVPDPVPVGMRPIAYRADDQPSDWRGIRPLSELREDPEPTLGWVSIELLDPTGIPFAGFELTLVHCDGRRDRVVLDRAGRFTARQVATPGPSRIEWPARVELTMGATVVGMDGFVRKGGDIAVSRQPQAPTVLPGLDRHHRVIVEAPVQPRTTCVRLVGMLFELNKAFLLPAALEGIRLLPHMYEKLPSAEILVVGHTDRTGKKYRNDSLSLERAEAVLAFLRDDVDAWLANYGSDTDYSRRWGATEDLLMLSSLPREALPYYSPEQAEHSFDAAVRRFQAAQGLEVDGDAGPQTRRALIAEYMALDGTTLPAEAVAVAHGCGENFPVVTTDDGVEQLDNRRVEVFFFADGIDPRPAAKNSGPGSTDYPAWVHAIDEERTFTPAQAGRGRVRVFTDFDVGYAHFAGLVLELRSVDGAYSQRIDPRDTPQQLGSFLDFEFENVPKASFLTLVKITDKGGEEALFEDVPFWELASRHDSRGQETDPFDPVPGADDGAIEEDEA